MAMPLVLIVDDSPTIRRMVAASLAAVPAAATAEAASGLQAIESLAVMPVQIMILDLNMPDMNGLDVLRFVRTHGRYRDTPVIVLTTRGDESSRAAALQAGASAYMTKPFSPVALAAAVTDLLGAARESQ